MRQAKQSVTFHHVRKPAFTLIELLVVISIIALLLAIMMPALSRVKESARSVICQTRLKQMGTAIILYAQNNDDEFITHDWWDHDGNSIPDRPGYWFYRLSVYLDDVNNDDQLGEFMRCPSGRAAKDFKDSDAFYWGAIDYGLQRYDSGKISAAGANYQPAKLSSLRRPSRFATVFDFFYGDRDVGVIQSGSVTKWRWNQVLNNSDHPEFKEYVLRHKKDGINMVRADGSTNYVSDPDWDEDMIPFGKRNND